MSQSAIVPCSSCDGLNRIPLDRFGDHPRCATCKQPLVPDHPIELSDDNFDRFVSRCSLPVVVDFWAAWCGPCRMMAPHFEAAARDLLGEAMLAKLDTEHARAIAGRFDIRSIPTLIAFAQAREMGRTSGAMTQPQIVAWVRQLRATSAT